MSVGALLDLSQDLGSRLTRSAHERGSSVTWHDTYGVKQQRVRDAGMFAGRVGEAFFLAALYAANRDTTCRSFALRAVADLRKDARSPAAVRDLQEQTGVGLAGVGSIVYAFVRMAYFLDDETLLADASRIAAVLDTDRIVETHGFTVQFGAAGALFGLLALAEEDEPTALERSISLGDHILAARVLDEPSACRVWITEGEDPTTGFAHGTSGIGCSLATLYGRTRLQRFRDALVESFEFERSITRRDGLLWPDSRRQRPDMLTWNWCRGGPSIGFSRLAALEDKDDEFQDDITLDLRNVLGVHCYQKPFGRDNLCCGNFGRIDLLLEAGRRLGNENLMALALERAVTCTERAATHGYDIPDPGGSDHLQPGFWQGVSGIGYELLRLTAPDRFPSVLLFG